MILPGTTITFFGIVLFRIDIVFSLDKTIFSISLASNSKDKFMVNFVLPLKETG